MKKLVALAVLLVTLVSCNKDSEQYCEIVDYHNNANTNGWQEIKRVPSNYDEEFEIFNRYQDGFRHKRVVECSDVY